VIRVDLPDMTTTDRLIEALYVAAGAREGTLQATQWRRLARDVEAALDELPGHDARLTAWTNHLTAQTAQTGEAE
jgi:hypothetical protein